MKKILCFLAICLLCSACSTIISGTTTTVNLQPSDSEYQEPIKVQIKGKYSAQTINLPGTFSTKTGNDSLVVTVKDKCFRETSTVLEPKINYWVLGNFITGGLTGTTTDALSGALWTYDDVYVINVEENGTCKASK